MFSVSLQTSLVLSSETQTQRVENIFLLLPIFPWAIWKFQVEPNLQNGRGEVQGLGNRLKFRKKSVEQQNDKIEDIS